MPFIHPRATVLGDVRLGPRASVWPGAVLRGDSAVITVGEASNVQDGAIVHVDDGVPASIGARVAVAHGAIVHGANVEDDCLIGIGAIVLNRVRVGRGSIVAAGALCPEGMQIPPGSLVMGVPGRVVRPTTSEERERIARTVQSYLALQEAHRRGEFPAAPGLELATENPRA
ncbi:MAG TPA: gamma carbonic anhydrase family protein [Gemmatimonadaceae bacterium]|nr:gamma carbonic anhydrase family protein [Gemmatimonadaceae bacterium]